MQRSVRLTLVLGTVVSVLLAGAGTAAAAPAAPTTGIAGSVRAPSGEALPGVCVSATSPAGAASTTTGPDGSYVLPALSPGSYALQAVDCRPSPRYQTRYWRDAATSPAADPVTVVGGETFQADVTLPLAGSLAGTVTDDTGHPVGGACVRAEEQNGPSRSGTTASDGTWFVGGLRPATYRVDVTGCGANYRERWFGGATRQVATAVSLALGEQRRAVDVVLPRGASFSGVVRADGSATATVGTCVSATSADDTDSGSATVGRDGTYRLLGLAGGSYTVRFADCTSRPRFTEQYFDHAPGRTAATPLTLAAGAERTGIDADLQAAGAVAGRVTDAGGSGLAGACVSAARRSSTGFDTVAGTSTGADGSYVLGGLPVGDVVVSFSGCAAGQFISRSYADARFLTGATAVHVTAGGLTARVDEVLPAAGSISGSVRDGSGASLAGVCVSAIRLSDQAGNQTRTDAQGGWTLGGLELGSYAVSAQSCDGAGDLVPSYWRTGTTQAGATPVDVNAGSTTNGIALVARTGLSVSGRVTAAGTPVPGACVDARPVTYRPGMTNRSARTQPDGTYRLAGLDADSYVVHVADCDSGRLAGQYWRGAGTQAAATPVTLTTEPVTGIDANLVQAGALTGTVRDSAGSPVAGVCASASGPGEGSAVTATDGSYRVGGLLPGSYTVRLSPCQGQDLVPGYVPGQTGGGPRPLTVRAGETVPGADAVLQAGTDIAVLVVDGAGRPVASTCVSTSGAGTRTGADGTALLRGLTPGRHDVSVYDCAGEGFLSRPGVRHALVSQPAGQASPVRLAVDRGTRLAGTVRDGAGQPVAGACLQTSQPGSFSASSSDASGAFALGAGDGTTSLFAFDCSGGDRTATSRVLQVVQGVAQSGLQLRLGDGGSISGRVTDAAGPVARACVSFRGLGRLAFTDADGTYLLHGVPAGPAVVSFQDCGAGNHLAQWWHGRGDEQSADPVSVTTGHRSTGVDALLLPGAAISGSVTDPGGAPADQACVEVHATPDDRLVASVSTDGDGRFRATSLASGGYRVRVRDCATGARSAWAGGTDYATARTVQVTAGQADGAAALVLPDGPADGSLPGAPTGVSVSPGAASAAVSWQAPASDGGSPVTGYDVTTRPSTTTRTVGADTRTVRLDGLVDGTAYVAVVRAVTARGSGAPAESASFTSGRPASRILVTLSPAAAVDGQQVQVRATVAGGSSPPTGAVVVTLDGAPVATAPLSGGQATVTVAAHVPGGRVQVSYAGDDGHAPGAATALLMVSAAPSRTTLAVTPAAASTVADPVRLQATVTSAAGGPPHGRVTFLDGTSSLGDAELDDAGHAELSARLAVGSHALSARYAGTAATASSASDVVTQQVRLVGTSVSLTAPSTVLHGAPLDLVVTVQPESPGDLGGAVEVLDGLNLVGRGRVAPGGVLHLDASALATGDHALTARYLGDDRHAASATTGTSPVRVQQRTQTRLTLVGVPAVTGQSFTAVASVRDEAGDAVPGAVQLVLAGRTLAAQPLDRFGRAEFPGLVLPVGRHVLTAVFPDGGLLAASTSLPAAALVDRSATRLVTSTQPGQPAAGAPTVLDVQVAVVDPGAGLPDGSVTVQEGGRLLGTGALDAGTAHLDLGDLPAGTHDLDIAYSGSPSFRPSVLALPLQVAARDRVVRVRVEDESGAALPGALVVVHDVTGAVLTATAGADGTAELRGVQDGTQRFAALADDHQGAGADIPVAGGAGRGTIVLRSGAQVVTSVGVSRMTAEQAAASGVDLAPPANSHAVAFVLDVPGLGQVCGYAADSGILAARPSPACPLPLARDGLLDSRSGGGGGSGAGGGGSGGGGGGSTRLTYSSVGGHPQFVAMTLPGARWLKEFFAVTLTVLNPNSADFTLTGGSATLALPTGVSLADVVGAPQTSTKAVRDVPGGGRASATWIVRGDQEGDRAVQAHYTAELAPIGARMDVTAASNPFHVYGAAALQMVVETDDQLVPDLPFRLRVGLRNVAPVPVYGASVTLTRPSGAGYVFQPRQQTTFASAEIAPGTTWWSGDYEALSASAAAVSPDQLFVRQVAGDLDRVVTSVQTRPARYARVADAPSLQVSRGDADSTVTWAPVAGASAYAVFDTANHSTPFSDEAPLVTTSAGVTSAHVPSADVGRYYAVSARVGGAWVMRHPLVLSDATPLPPVAVQTAPADALYATLSDWGHGLVEQYGDRYPATYRAFDAYLAALDTAHTPQQVEGLHRFLSAAQMATDAEIWGNRYTEMACGAYLAGLKDVLGYAVGRTADRFKVADLLKKQLGPVARDLVQNRFLRVYALRVAATLVEKAPDYGLKALTGDDLAGLVTGALVDGILDKDCSVLMKLQHVVVDAQLSSALQLAQAWTGTTAVNTAQLQTATRALGDHLAAYADDAAGALHELGFAEIFTLGGAAVDEGAGGWRTALDFASLLPTPPTKALSGVLRGLDATRAAVFAPAYVAEGVVLSDNALLTAPVQFGKLLTVLGLAPAPATPAASRASSRGAALRVQSLALAGDPLLPGYDSPDVTRAYLLGPGHLAVSAGGGRLTASTDTTGSRGAVLVEGDDGAAAVLDGPVPDTYTVDRTGPGPLFLAVARRGRTSSAVVRVPDRPGSTTYTLQAAGLAGGLTPPPGAGPGAPAPEPPAPVVPTTPGGAAGAGTSAGGADPVGTTVPPAPPLGSGGGGGSRPSTGTAEPFPPMAATGTAAPACAPSVEGPTVVRPAGSPVVVTVRGVPGQVTWLFAYVRPETTYRLLRVVRLGADGTARALIRPTGSSRLYAESTDCAAGASTVVVVSNAVVLAARRTAVRTLAFSGTVVPRRSGHEVRVYRRGPHGPVLMAVTRTDGGGRWALLRRFAAAGVLRVRAVVPGTLDAASGMTAWSQVDVR